MLKLKLSDIKNDEILVETEKTKKKLCFKVEGDLKEVIDRAKKLRRLILSPYFFAQKKGDRSLSQILGSGGIY